MSVLSPKKNDINLTVCYLNIKLLFRVGIMCTLKLRNGQKTRLSERNRFCEFDLIDAL